MRDFNLPQFELFQSRHIPGDSLATNICQRIVNSKLLKKLAGTTRLELATSAVTGQRSNQLNYVPPRFLMQQSGDCMSTFTRNSATVSYSSIVTDASGIVEIWKGVLENGQLLIESLFFDDLMIGRSASEPRR